jgi:hypothetical protein
MSRIVKKGATSQSIYFDVFDSTSSTGGRKTGLAYNTSSLIAYYVRNQNTAVAITLATLAAANTAWSSGGFKEVDATNAPGVYRLDVPDAAFATGADSVVVVILGATGMVMSAENVQLVAVDLQDAVRAGLTALPNANAEAAGGLYTRGTGAGQINQDANGRVDVNGKAWAGGAIPAPNVTGVPIVDDKYLLGTIYSTPATAGIQDINVINWKGATAPAMTGDAYARLGAPAGASVSADVAAVKGVLPSALVSGRIDASVGAYQTGLTPLQPATAGRTLVVDAAGLADANMVKLGPTGAGTAQTARDIGTSVLVSSGTGTGQLDVTSGVVKANLAQILGTALTETAGQIAGGFKKFFNIATPAATMDHGVLVDTVTTYTGNTPQTGDAYARIGAAGAGLTALGDTRIAHLDADVSSRSTYAGADTAGTTTLLARPSPLDAAGTRTAVGLASANLDTQIGTLATSSALATVNTTVNGINTKTANLPSDPADASDVAAAFTALASHGDSAWATASGFSTIGAGDVWDVLLADHESAGSMGQSLFYAQQGATSADTKATDIFGDTQAIRGVTDNLVQTGGKLWVLDDAGNPLPKVDDIKAGVWDEALAGHTTDGTAGKVLTDVGSQVGTIEGRIGTPAFGDLAGDIAHAQSSIDGLGTAIGALVIPSATDNADAVLAATYEGAETVQDHFRLARASLYGKANGLAGTTVHYRDAADAKNRLTATVDSDGNRLAVTADAS